MNGLLTRHQIVAHWVPGAIFVAAILPLFFNMSWSQAMSSSADHPTIALFAFIVAAFIFGEIFDSIRDVCEWGLDKIHKKVTWSFFAEASEDKRKSLEEYYFIYYVFNINTLIALLFVAGTFLIQGQWSV